jgi:transaldolase
MTSSTSIKPSPRQLSRMEQMTALGADWWNDSCTPSEVAEAVSLGAVGGTSNPVIVFQAIKSNPELCLPLLDQFITDNPRETEDDIAWRLIHELGRRAAAELFPVFQRTGGEKGFLSMQVNPKLYPSPALMVAQATGLAELAPNIAIKAPATAAGLEAMEEMTARGIRVNATVSFSVAQAIAVSAAFERGLERARAAGRDTSAIRPYITIMIGRVDDHLKRVAERDGIATTAGAIDWSGIAVFKHAHALFKKSGRPGTLLAAAYRHEGHWAEIIGTGVLQTVPYSWWKQFDTSARAPTLTLEQPMDDAILAELRRKFPDFNRAYDENGMHPEAFIRYGATVHTLHQFIDGYSQLLAFVRARMLP